jgi:L,D-peptidoglycan transpeptidase YkuD (ErfK/YbiS/YcfS/YnhG family)
MLSRRALLSAGPGLLLGACATTVPLARPQVVEVVAQRGATTGMLTFAGRQYSCAVGRTGVQSPKREGDGHTPAGLFPFREVRFRPDRMSAPKTGLPTYPATPVDGWCDDPADPAYNRLVRLPYQSDAETMWRDDHLYDVLAVIGYNDVTPVPSAGSAIFMHVARMDGDKLLPTAGCVSLRKEHLLEVLGGCAPGAMIRIHRG